MALAVATEEAGLEYATFQDHPYQPRFLDTWTIMSWVGAHEPRPHLGERAQPAAAPARRARARRGILDLLTGGRVVLGLGAGGFPQAAEAMGAPRRSPAESGDALAEAITVIRELLDTDAAGGVFLDHEHHPVRGAKRGPAPVQRPIPIWLGVLRPKGLRLVGRVADGWLPSFGRLEHGAASLDAGHAVIDAAARAADASPRHPAAAERRAAGRPARRARRPRDAARRRHVHRHRRRRGAHRRPGRAHRPRDP